MARQLQLQNLIAEADFRRIASACVFPDWLGFLGLALHYTEDAESHNPVISRKVAPQLGRLVEIASPAQRFLRSCATTHGQERLRWNDLTMVEVSIRPEMRVPRGTSHL